MTRVEALKREARRLLGVATREFVPPEIQRVGRNISRHGLNLRAETIRRAPAGREYFLRRTKLQNVHKPSLGGFKTKIKKKVKGER